MFCINLSNHMQKNIIFEAIKLDNSPESFIYAIHAQWWTKWCDFVNIQYAFAKHNDPNYTRYQNIDLISQNQSHDERSESGYGRPIKIQNHQR